MAKDGLGDRCKSFDLPPVRKIENLSAVLFERAEPILTSPSKP